MKTPWRVWHSLVSGRHKEQHEPLWSGWARLLFPLLTALSVAWFLMRVIPKPIRATYPCQQAAFPLLSSCVIWLLGLKSVLVSWLGVRLRFRRFGPVFCVAGGLLVLGLVAWAAEKAANPLPPQPQGITYGSPSGDPPNSPIGLPKGIFAGRVTWMRDTNATPWDGSAGYWWQDATGIDQAAVDRMISMSLRALTGSVSDTEAWDKVFRFYNSNHNRGNVGYAPNELIALKINLNNNYPGATGTNNYADASKQTVLSLLRQLVNKAGVPQTNIAVYDAVRDIPPWLSQPCRAEFPSVQWFDASGTAGHVSTWVTNNSSYSVTNACGGPLVVAGCASRATYLINLPLLKGHGYSGVTLAGKNHYGSIPLRDHSAYLVSSQTTQALYSPLVDLMGSRQLGDKTVLYVNDGLFGNSATHAYNTRAQSAFTNLFNGQWSASIFMSFDPVAIDSVCVDFLYAEFGLTLGLADDGYWKAARRCDHYLHEAALADNPPSGTVYRPDGARLGSQGVHEHWNNPIDKQYSRNLSTNGTGIELVAVHNLAAALNLVSPTNGTVVAPGNNILLQATPNAYAPLARVDYFANGLLVGTSTNAPFGFTWTNPPAGNWTLNATGTDPDGYGCTSADVDIRVLGVKVAITHPPGGAAFPEGTNLTLQAAAASDFGSVTQVNYYVNGSLLPGTSASAPYSIVWSNVAAGTWGLSATARDDTGLSGGSAVVTVTAVRDIRVGLTGPAAWTVFPEGTNYALSATASCPVTAVSRVDFYDSGTWIGRADGSPYSVVRSNTPAGLRALWAVATETAGHSATSAVVNISVVPRQPVIAGTLYVDLRATNYGSGAGWLNQGTLGDFSCWWPYPTLELNAAGTTFPGIHFDGSQRFDGPGTEPDIDGSSDRSIEVWALEPAPLGSIETLVSWGIAGHSAGFSACYGASWSYGAFMDGPYADPCNAGWGSDAAIPAPGVWHHLVYVYDGGTQLKVYVDGVATVARTLPYPLSTWQSAAIVIGATYWLSGNYWIPFNGYINSVRVHGGVLSANDVWANYLLGPVQWHPGPVTILTQPSDLMVAEQSDGILSIAPDGAGPFSFQWYRAGAPLAGETGPTCSLTNLMWADSGSQYYCVVAPLYDCTSCITTSRVAMITVQPVLPAVLYCAAVASKDMFGLMFSTIPGGKYQVEYKDLLTAKAWAPVGPAQTASGTSMTVADDSNCFTNQHRFYRVIRPH